jgi:23S rRNA pseudouridine1911/1915/1917 synthase
MIEIPIVYEDDSILVISKPAGVIVNRAESVQSETLQDWADKKIGDNYIQFQNDLSSTEFIARSGIVHRLDKDTSGLLIIAKNPEVFIRLQAQFKERDIDKQYLTLVHGLVVPKVGEIRASVGRLPWNRERFGVLPGGKEASTSYSVISYYQLSANKYSYLSVFPHTGRTHQIRIHLKYINHTVVSDEFYAGRKTCRQDKNICPRLFLHAYKLSFTNPITNKQLNLENPLPDDLNHVLSKLSKIQ